MEFKKIARFPRDLGFLDDKFEKNVPIANRETQPLL
jgi:hypothetical protein